jgi:hypothetical protein
MRWKISPRGHDPRQIDLLAIIALLLIVGGAYVYLADHTSTKPSVSTFIVPSQHVRW